MARVDELESRIEELEQRQQELVEIVAELREIAPENMDGTPMAMFDAKTWKHPEMGIHVYNAVEEAVSDSVTNYATKQEVKDRVREEHEHTKSELRAKIKVLVDENVLEERNDKIRIHPDAKDIDPDELFKSNLTQAEERREYAASKGEPVDNPADKFN